MARAMYFESNRSSEEGMLAVGTVVKNRMQSGRYPSSACGVVGQPNQFAQGALSKPVSGRSWALALQTADSVLAGRRHAHVQQAMHFHTAGYTFPYRNMAYVVAAGGNVFYEKRAPGSFTPIHPNILVARAAEPRTRPSERIVVARAEEVETRPARRSDLVHLASADDTDKPRLSRTTIPLREPVRSGHADEKPTKAGTGRAALARLAEERGADRRSADRRPADRLRQDRIRLAQLEDDALPRHARTRSDAPSHASHGFDLPKRPSSLRTEPSKPVPSPSTSTVKSTKAQPGARDGGIALAYKNTAKTKAVAPPPVPTKPQQHPVAKTARDGSKKKG